MKLTEYLDAINATLVITYHPNQGRRFSCNIEHADVKGDGVLIGEYGDGSCPRSAAIDYFRQVTGKALAINAGTKYRREFIVPKNLEVDI